MVNLRKLEDSDLTEISCWRLSATDLLYWAQITDAKCDLRGKLAEWRRDPGSSAFVLVLDSTVVGYGEIWAEADEIELARLIVQPAFRGQGLGRVLVQKLVEEGKCRSRNIWLRVHPENLLARKLYTRVGFEIASNDEQKIFNEGQPVEYIWMRLLGVR